jgi:hypothetical protein
MTIGEDVLSTKKWTSLWLVTLQIIGSIGLFRVCVSHLEHWSCYRWIKKRRGKKLVAEQDDVENTTGSMLEFQAYSCEVTH